MLIIDQLKKGDQPLRLVALGVLVGLGLLLVGLFFVQVVSGKRYKASQVSQSFRTVRIPAVRGRIFDRRGVPLADNRSSYNVNLYLEELRPQFQAAYAERTKGRRLSRQERVELGREIRYQVVSNLVAQASAALRQSVALDPKQFHEHYEQRLALPMPVFPDLPLAGVARFEEQASALPGFVLEIQPLRTYPQRVVAAHVLGYLKRNDRPEDEDLYTRYSMPAYTGAAGLELSYDRSLRGTPGVKSVLVNNLGYRESESTWNEAQPGDNLVLTLDLELQKAAERALAASEAKPRGAIVVMDVQNGDVLALVSLPAYDPNLFLPRLLEADWQAYLEPRQAPLFNRATAGSYLPGSTVKILVGLAALEAGILDPDKLYHSPGYYQLGKRRIKDEAQGGQPASFDFKRALKQSSNAYFVHYGLLTGIDDLVAMGQRFHLGEKTALPLPRGQESTGIFPTPDWREHRLGGTWHDGDTANISMGQGYVTITPIQMAVLVSAVANGGTVFWPRLVARVEPADPTRAHEAIDWPAGRVRDTLKVSRRNLKLVRDAMLADVEDADGTGRKAHIEGLPICAKTGTAQMPKRGYMDYITWFASFAPYDAPRYAVVVVVESGVSGGTTCAPIAREVYLAIQELQARPDPPGRPLARNEP